MQGLGCTVSVARKTEGSKRSVQDTAALLTTSHPSTTRHVPVVVVDGKAAGSKELVGTVVLDDTPMSPEAQSLVRSARMNGYRVESPR